VLVSCTSVAINSRGVVKLVLTSGGVTNESIRDALVDLLRKPIAESARCVSHGAVGPPDARLWLGTKLGRRRASVPQDDQPGLGVAGGS
jgi:hypothetical protein